MPGMKKILITGHTRGLGKSIFDHFSDKKWHIIGLSRSTGTAIPDDINKIIDIAKECDIFFNNVYYGTSQSDLITQLYKNVAIVSSGSVAADVNSSLFPDNSYYNDKRDLELTHKKYKRITNHPMLLLKMGYLEKFTDRPSIPYHQILSAIDLWIENPRISMIEFENNKDVLNMVGATDVVWHEEN
jgi:hypothetical protein